ncbi:MAG: hypothetical protein KatS3mg015_1560 [Fimbriimonadales bacterium]|nr:MAG: hypothetical protein KatS3mg015_1560 [Fimbriimonadales bacterium]
MQTTKGALCVLAGLMATLANATTFDVRLLDRGGDFSFSAYSDYWEPGINQVGSRPPVQLDGANRSAQIYIVSEGTARPGWRFAGERFLTVHGSVQWSGSPNSTQVLRISTLIEDLDNGYTYELSSWLDQTGQHTTGPVQFIAPTTRIRWTDTIDLITGSTGTLTQFVSANHTMNMQPVPEPATGFVLFALAVGAVRRRR